VFFGQWLFHRNRGESKLALALAEQMEKIGEAHNNVSVQLMGRWASGCTRLNLGDFVAARALLERCHGLADPARRSVPYALNLAYLAQTLAHLGYVDQARSRLNEALSEARQPMFSHTKAEVLIAACSVDLLTGSPEMQRHAEELLALSTERGLPHYLAWATVFRGLSLTALGLGRVNIAFVASRFARCHGRPIRGRAELSPGNRGSKAPERKVLGTPGIDQLGAPLV
jgi:hypothetical protein